MAGKSAGGAYDDEFSEDELRALNEHSSSVAIPPAEDDDAKPIAPEQVAAEQGLAPKPVDPAPAAPAPVDPAAAPVAQTEDEKFAAFLAQHQGKSPEELAKLAFQQSQRAQREGFQARQARETLETAQNRVRDAIARREQGKAEIAARRAKFDEDLQSDPDKVTREIHEQRLAEEEARLDREAHDARLDSAIALASTAIPDFKDRASEIYAFGGEMGYSQEELGQISDGRDIVTLYLAGLTGRMIKAGIIDTRGNFLQAPQPIAQTDPRLNTPEPLRTLSSSPARTAAGGKTAEDQAHDILKMSDEDFAKLDPKVLDNLLKQL